MNNALLPIELIIQISEKLYSDSGIYSELSFASKTTKAIFDKLANKENFESYLERSLYCFKRCYCCKKKIQNPLDFFGKKILFCKYCGSLIPKISATQALKNYLITENQLDTLSYFLTRNRHAVYCRYFLVSDVTELQYQYNTEEDIKKYHRKKKLDN
jgi:hypothetical protein